MKATAIFLFFTILLSSALNAAQTCRNDMIASAPDSRYLDNGDGTITDNDTGLMWKKCSEGQTGSDCSVGSANTYNWSSALQVPATINTSGGYASHVDWYLPNINELSSLVEERCYLPAININFFPNTLTASCYWSSSPNGYNSSNTWCVFSNYGSNSSSSRASGNPVRLVRVPQ